MTVAVLFVEPWGSYAGDLWHRPDVELWYRAKDARRYVGPHPVVAHPPCARWCRMAGVVEARYGIARGEDGGCFESALAAVRRWGGVLEHPAWSDAWKAFDLPSPDPDGGWLRGECGGSVCHVEQGNYGHRARKATWLYAHHVDPIPDLVWGRSSATRWASWAGNHNRGKVVERLSKRERNATPAAFRDLLLDIARSVHR